jgi:hypothetical protein
VVQAVAAQEALQALELLELQIQVAAQAAVDRQAVVLLRTAVMVVLAW